MFYAHPLGIIGPLPWRSTEGGKTAILAHGFWLRRYKSVVLSQALVMFSPNYFLIIVGDRVLTEYFLNINTEVGYNQQLSHDFWLYPTSVLLKSALLLEKSPFCVGDKSREMP